MKVIEGDLVLTKDTIFNEDIIVHGEIRCEGGLWYINARNIEAANIEAWDIKAENIKAWNIEAWNIEAANIKAENIKAENIKAWDISFYALCIAYNSIKCKSWKGKRENHIIKALDGEIEIIDEKKYCDKCGAKLK